MEELIERCAQDFLLFVEAGCTAVDQANDRAALQLFHCAALLDGTSSLPEVGIGYLHLCRKNFAAAREHFANAVERDGNSELAQALYALSSALLPEKHSQGMSLLATANPRSQGVRDLLAKANDFFATVR